MQKRDLKEKQVMMLSHFSTLLRLGMVLAGGSGFVIGLSLGIWKETSFGTALFRGSVLCLIFGILARMLLIRLLHAHVQQIQIQKNSKGRLSKEGLQK